MKYNIIIGGAAGQGVKTLSKLTGKILKHHGFYTYTNTIYMSRIRGGHNYFQIRFSDQALYTHEKEANLIIGLNDETIKLHQNSLKTDGKILTDQTCQIEGKNLIKLPSKEWASELKDKKLSTYVLLGSLVKIFDLDEIISKQDLTHQQVMAFDKGYQATNTCFQTKQAIKDQNILISGNQATALGAIAAGMDFFSTYPMTPATGVMTYLAQNQKACGYVVEQAEDEIAAINMATGSSYAGARSFIATSGGGFALMTEGLGMASIAELPLVILNVQRPGPATGMPTKTSQGDLAFILHASPDEYPKMVIALTDIESAFYQTFRAFNLADQYQMPIILLSDRYLADSTATVKAFDLEGLSIERSIAQENMVTYKRHEITQTGISPRLLPGNPSFTVMADSHEHDEAVNIVEDAEMRVRMHDKRLRKEKQLQKEIIEPEYYGCQDADTLIIGWGSTRGLLKELAEDDTFINQKIASLSFSDIYPLPTKKLLSLYKKDLQLISVEHNATGQFAKYLRSETGIHIEKQILKYDGRQFDISTLKHKILEVL